MSSLVWSPLYASTSSPALMDHGTWTVACSCFLLGYENMFHCGSTRVRGKQLEVLFLNSNHSTDSDFVYTFCPDQPRFLPIQFLKTTDFLSMNWSQNCAYKRSTFYYILHLKVSLSLIIFSYTHDSIHCCFWYHSISFNPSMTNYLNKNLLIILPYSHYDPLRIYKLYKAFYLHIDNLLLLLFTLRNLVLWPSYYITMFISYEKFPYIYIR